MPAPKIPVDPARTSGQHLVTDLPTGPIPLPGDVLTVTDPHGRTGLARLACTDLARKRLYLAVTWPHPLDRPTPAEPPVRWVQAPALTAAVFAAGGTVHPVDLAAHLAADQETSRV
ncbi:hypothetical protein [Micromonospora aurantiaca (nom. illeg.)]|uniref:hypothetical protein n=1 Tax=Micromonospora aurantiaca (nom. illeg.) TaxID=47850 RepID=UPI00119D1F17|nr:hypothetical protein [Micromonospora aurantiaca]MBC9005162.1 hypothetical protein [Micromonospora aurantiaca]